jgi:NADH:ubiquinone oxidoreductase subunit 5 (chain L)/Multisubunit Na+/H+ antiporter, MnhA subunit
MTGGNQSQTDESSAKLKLSASGDSSTDGQERSIYSHLQIPVRLTQTMWTLWILSISALVFWIWRGGTFAITLDVKTGWIPTQLFNVDGVTLIIWVAATFFSGIVHSYSRRYLVGEQHQDRFFIFAFGFTLAVLVLVAANHIALFTVSWMTMGLLMAALIGHVRGWSQAQTAASFARRYFLISGTFVAVAGGILWWTADVVTIDSAGSAAVIIGLSPLTIASVTVALILAAMIQSALIPFHSWMLSSMTAPTPASALMHAGFVNAGGILLVRFGPIIEADTRLLILIMFIGALSALGGKFLKTVQSDAKRKLGCSTIGQMGFMIMQIGLGFFAAAITHLILHGCYKAYQFLSVGDTVKRLSPETVDESTEAEGKFTIRGVIMTVITAITGGSIFTLITGKGSAPDSGLLLSGLIVITTLHATQRMMQHTTVSSYLRYGAVLVVFMPAIAIYGFLYNGIAAVMKTGGMTPAVPTELTVVHAIVAGGFLVSYAVIETGVYQRSRWLYVLLKNTSQPPGETLLTTTEEYDDH